MSQTLTDASLCLVEVLQGNSAQIVQDSAKSCIMEKARRELQPAAAGGSPNPPEIAHLLCGQPVHPDFPAFAGRVPLCNLGASTCPGHRGPWALTCTTHSSIYPAYQRTPHKASKTSYPYVSQRRGIQCHSHLSSDRTTKATQKPQVSCCDPRISLLL